MNDDLASPALERVRQALKWIGGVAGAALSLAELFGVDGVPAVVLVRGRERSPLLDGVKSRGQLAAALESALAGPLQTVASN
jgi:hypothetical protein